MSKSHMEIMTITSDGEADDEELENEVIVNLFDIEEQII